MQKVSLSNKVFTENPLLDEIIYNARQLATGVILKDSDKANSAETLESLQNGDVLIAIDRGLVKFENFYYGREILTEFYGTSYEAQKIIDKYIDDNKLIPESDRESLLRLAKTRFLENFEETNNYYRMLAGLPNYDSSGIWEGLWIDTKAIGEIQTPIECVAKFCPQIENRILGSYPDPDWELIHKLSLADINILETNGTLESITKNADQLAIWELTRNDVEYLMHLGIKCIDPVVSRPAEQFALLYCPSCDSEEVQKRFKELFEANRLYLLYTVYSEAYKFKSEYYDNFMMVFLVIQTIIDMVIEMPEYIIRRDVFDARTCKYIFEANGVKFFSDIPLKYQISLVKNLNKLIKFKSTDKCIIDIISLFGFDNISAFKYYILRDRNVGNPEELDYYNNTKIVQTTDDAYTQKKVIYSNNASHTLLVINGDVNATILMPDDEDAYVLASTLHIDAKAEIYYIIDDNDKNYDLKFIKVPLQGSYDDFIRTESNVYDYDSIVDGDAYWIGDQNYDIVKSNVKDLDFNVLRSKYYSISAIVDLTKRNFTLTYFLNILLYNRVDSSVLKVALPNISTLKKFELIDVIITLYALSYIYYGIEDDIVDTRTKAVQLLGFNMEADLAEISNFLYENHGRLTLKDLHCDNFKQPDEGKIKGYDMSYTAIGYDELHDIYFTNKDIYDHVVSMLVNPPNKRIYDAYKYIYDSLFITNCNMEKFLVLDNEILNEYMSLGYVTKTFRIPKYSEYSDITLYKRDYRSFESNLKSGILYMEQRDDFDSSHQLDLYVFDKDSTLHTIDWNGNFYKFNYDPEVENSIPLRDILNELGITGEIVNATSSEEDITITKNEDDEWMFILNNQLDYEVQITVTDEFRNYVISVRGRLENVGTARMAYTYREYLRYKDPILYNYIQNIAAMPKDSDRQEASVNAIQSIITYLRDYINQDGDLYFDLNAIFSGLPSISLDFITKYIEEVIDFFKSFKIFTHGASLIYVFDDKFENYVHLIDDILIKYLFDKSEIIKIEDFLSGKMKMIGDKIYHSGPGIGMMTNKSDKMALLDKVWLDIDTWVQKNYKEYYDSDRYSEFTNIIREAASRYDVLKTISDKVFTETITRYYCTVCGKEVNDIAGHCHYCGADLMVPGNREERITTRTWNDIPLLSACDAIVNMLIDLEKNDKYNIHESIDSMNGTKDLDDFYNEWMSDLYTLFTSSFEFNDGEYVKTIYYCPECNKEVDSDEVICPHCGAIFKQPIARKHYITHIKDTMDRSSKFTWNRFLPIVDGMNKTKIFKSLFDDGLSNIHEDYYSIITQEFPPHVFDE